MTLTCFKAYDIRGRLGIDLDEDIAYRIGRAFAQASNAKTVVLGCDVRASNTEPAVRLNVEVRGGEGLVAEGVEKVKALLVG